MIKIACLLFLFVVVYYIFKEHSSAFTSLFWKSASSFCFLLVGFCAFAACVDRRYGEWMLIGLVSGAIGDVLLALPFCYPKRKNLFFLGGLLFFLFGHLAYVAALFVMPVKAGILVAICSILLALLVIEVLKKKQVDFQEMRLPSTVYAAVILFMEACALWHLQDGMLYCGILNIASLCFVLSDLILAFMLFGNRNTTRMTRWNLSLYYTAQLLLALTMLCYSNIKEMMFMKHVRMMYLKGCPHCKAAFAMVKELQDSYPELRGVNIEAIEEQEQKELADSLDYWYVPTYFVDGVKLLEGVPTKEKVEAVLRAAL